ncbi:MAG: Ig-like domain-containing protein [Rikenellaceae bacterium]
MIKRYFNRAYATLSVIIATLFIASLFTRCANVGRPTGGPIDSLPPVIVGMTPDNFTTNIDRYTRRIYIEFNEFVKLADQQKEFFTSPAMKTKPQLQIRGRGVVVTLRDTLLENTTYALNFGSSIQDNNEGNPLFSMRYIFSTGSEIDSMIVSGYAEDSYKSDSVSGSFFMFYPVDSVELHADYDSTLFNSTPAVIARAEANGTFLAQNLKPIPYHVYALEDTNSNMIYDPGTDRVGFIEGTRNPAELDGFAIWYDSLRKYVVAEPQLLFRMFLDKAFKRQLLVGSERPNQRKAILNFGANYPQIDSIILDSIPEDRVLVEYMTKGRDTLALWFDTPAEQLPDTIRGRVVYYKHDSLNELQRVSEPLALSWKFFESKQEEQEREKLEKEREKALEAGEEWIEPEVENPFKLNMATTREINPEQSITLDFEYPISRLDTAAITLQSLSAAAVELREKLNAQSAGADSTSLNSEKLRGAAQPFTLERDTMNIRRWHLRANWGDVGSEHYLTIPKGAITDIAGYANDSITQEWTPLNPEDFATLIVNVVEDKTTPSHYVVELLDENGSKIIERKIGVTAGTIQFNYVPAGNVTMRVIQDLNNNGEWDSGDLIQRRQPELAKMVETDGERKMATKVNWEIEISIEPEKLFAAESQAELAERLEKQDLQRLTTPSAASKPNN